MRESQAWLVVAKAVDQSVAGYSYICWSLWGDSMFGGPAFRPIRPVIKASLPLRTTMEERVWDYFDQGTPVVIWPLTEEGKRERVLSCLLLRELALDREAL